MGKDERYQFMVKLGDSEIPAFGLTTTDLPKASEVGEIVRSHMRQSFEESTIELKRGATQDAFYQWMREVAGAPVDPWTFDVHDETQGPDWIVVYTKSHFTGIQRVPHGDGTGVSIGVQMEGREVWLKCPHGMISDDETEVMFVAEKALENSIRVPADRCWKDG